jgi:hypothetical protein
MPTGCSSGQPGPRLTYFAPCAWRTSRLWLPPGPVNRVIHFLIQGPATNARRLATRAALPGGAGASPGTTSGHATRGQHALMSRATNLAPAVTPECTPWVPAPTIPTGTIAWAQIVPGLTTQDNRCPVRWRAFPPGQVEWIKSLVRLRPLNLATWQSELRQNEDRDFLLYVVEHGLSLTSGTDSSHLTPFKCNNYKSAYLSFAQVQVALVPDISAQRIFRP